MPATSANMGPGFDCLGIALELFNHFTVEEAPGFAMEIKGEGQNSLPHSTRNLVYKAMERLFARLNRPMQAVKISCMNEIPLARGLGSSAAAVVGGLIAANRLAGEAVTKEEILSLAVEMEGHGDNVAPAIFGGCQIVLKDEGQFLHVPVPVSTGLKGILFIPDFHISTAESRKILPSQVPRSDAVYNIARVALLSLALSGGNFDYLKIATRDRLHQPARQALFPAMEKLFNAALAAGAVGAFLSGSGSTIMALATEGGAINGIVKAMEEAAIGEKIEGRSRVVGFAAEGAKVVDNSK